MSKNNGRPKPKKPILLKQAKFPAFGECKPDRASASLGEKWFRFMRSDGVNGLAKASMKKAEVLAVESANPGNGFFKSFVQDLQRCYPRIFFWYVSNNLLAGKLEKYGFMFCIDRQDGEDVPGYVWDKDGLDVSTGQFCITSGMMKYWVCRNPIEPDTSDTPRLSESFTKMVVVNENDAQEYSSHFAFETEIFEIATIGTTILFKRYGRTQDQAGFVRKG